MELSLQRWGTSSDQDGQGLRTGKFWAAPSPTAFLPEPSPGAGGRRSALWVSTRGLTTLKGFSSLFF